MLPQFVVFNALKHCFRHTDLKLVAREEFVNQPLWRDLGQCVYCRQTERLKLAAENQTAKTNWCSVSLRFPLNRKGGNTGRYRWAEVGAFSSTITNSNLQRQTHWSESALSSGSHLASVNIVRNCYCRGLMLSPLFPEANWTLPSSRRRAVSQGLRHSSD